MNLRSDSTTVGKRRSGRAILVLLFFLALLGGGGYYGYERYLKNSNEGDMGEMVTTQVLRGPFDHIVLEQGEVESSSNIDINCEVKARGSSGTPILWVIPEGTYVKEGDKLVELDKSQLENELKTQRIAVAGAESLVISSEASVRTAEIALQEYLEGTYVSERKTLLSEVALAQQDLRRAELKLASARRLGAKGVIKGLQIEAEEFAVENARNMLDAAEAKLRVLDELTKEKNKVQFESDIEAANAKLESDRSTLAEEKDQLQEIEDQIAKCIIFSPAEGVVVYNNKFSSRGGAEFVVEEGASVRERQTIIKLPDPSRMQVKAKINESRITLIRDGMAAKVKVSAVPGDLLAQVKRVNKYAEPGSWFSSSVKEYAAFIEIVDPPENIRTGMTAEVRIYVEQLDDALQIPVHGVYEFKGHHFCLVRDTSGALETKEISIGATNDKMVTVDEGLEDGETIVLNPRQHLDLMEFPEIEDIVDRGKIQELGAEAADGPSEPISGGAGGPPGRGGPGGGAGRGGPGGPPGGGGGPPGGLGGGGFDPAAIVEGMFSRGDKDGDGKLAGDEISDRFKDRVSQWDTDGDGAISKDEAIKGMSSAGR